MSRRLRLALGSQRAFRATIKRVFAELDAGAGLAILGKGKWLKNALSQQNASREAGGRSLAKGGGR